MTRHARRSGPTLLLLLAALQLAACGGDDGRHYGNDPDPDSYLGELVRGLEISTLAINQAVEIPLMIDGEEVTRRPTPVIQGKDALLRIHLAEQAGWSTRDVKARVEFSAGGQVLEILEARQMIRGSSDPDDFDSTINLFVPAEYLSGDLSFRVSLHETRPDPPTGGDSSGARWPVEGLAPLHEIDPGGALEIVLVPVRYNADGSGRLPTVTDAQLELYRKYFYAMYPVATVNIQLHEPLDFNLPISSGGDGWGELLNEIVALRQAEDAAHNEYYYGVFAPAGSMGAYCSGGCVAGLSNLAWRATDAWARASIGLGFSGESSASTMAHEVGHAHGRLHVNCGINDEYYDFAYPYENGDIGKPGYDVTRDRFWASDRAKDIMSYCGPTWISDHNYIALYERAVAVNGLMRIHRPTDAVQIWRSLTITLGGGVVAGPDLDLDLPPAGETRLVQWLDGDGDVVGEVEGRFQPFSEAPAGLVLVPDPPAAAVAAHLPGYGTVEL